MRKIISIIGLLSILSLVFTSTALAMEFEKVMIKNDGKIKYIYRAIKESSEQTSNTLGVKSTSATNSLAGVLVTFYDKNENISAFETKYSVTVKSMLVPGFYLFNNLSGSSDRDLVINISSDTKVKAVMPNFKLNVQPR